MEKLGSEHKTALIRSYSVDAASKSKNKKSVKLSVSESSEEAQERVYNSAMSSDSLAYFYSRKIPELEISLCQTDIAKKNNNKNYSVNLLSKAPNEPIESLKLYVVWSPKTGYFFYRTEF